MSYVIYRIFIFTGFPRISDTKKFDAKKNFLLWRLLIGCCKINNQLTLWLKFCYPIGSLQNKENTHVKIGKTPTQTDHFFASETLGTRVQGTLSTFSVFRPLYFDRSTSTSLLRHFVKSGLPIGREVQVEVKFWSK